MTFPRYPQCSSLPNQSQAPGERSREWGPQEESVPSVRALLAVQSGTRQRGLRCDWDGQEGPGEAPQAREEEEEEVGVGGVWWHRQWRCLVVETRQQRWLAPVIVLLSSICSPSTRSVFAFGHRSRALSLSSHFDSPRHAVPHPTSLLLQFPPRCPPALCPYFLSLSLQRLKRYEEYSHIPAPIEDARFAFWRWGVSIRWRGGWTFKLINNPRPTNQPPPPSRPFLSTSLTSNFFGTPRSCFEESWWLTKADLERI